jgi:hypothetical protein
VTAGGGRGRLRPPTFWSGALAVATALLAAATVVLSVLIRGGLLANAVQPLLVTVPFAAVGVVVARRQPRNPVGWVLAAVGVLVMLANVGSLYAVLVYHLGHRWPFGPVAVLLDVTWEPALFVLPLAILLFPDGRLPSARWRWVLLAYLAVTTAYLVILGTVAVGYVAGRRIAVDSNGGVAAVDFPHGWVAASQHVILPVYAAFWLAFIARQVQAWHRSGQGAEQASAERRQQLKWLASGAAVSLAAVLFDVVAPSLDPHAPRVVQAAGVVVGIFLAALPAGIGVGILKYRLYEIDRIISRTLAYTIVTGLLVGVYAAVVLLATQVLAVKSGVAVAGSTLAAAALFSPLRGRVQRVVDRRFNRARYDADRMVAAFAARLQDAVDLEAVRGDLAGTVHRALEPEHVSVWISGQTR